MRTISENEDAVIRWLVENAPVSKEDESFLPKLLPSIEGLRVLEECKCWCPSIDFVQDSRKGYWIIAEAVGSSPGAVSVELILWGNERQISALEVVVYNDSGDKKVPLPMANTLKTWEQAGEISND
jgi:hypothetical protein